MNATVNIATLNGFLMTLSHVSDVISGFSLQQDGFIHHFHKRINLNPFKT